MLPKYSEMGIVLREIVGLDHWQRGKAEQWFTWCGWGFIHVTQGYSKGSEVFPLPSLLCLSLQNGVILFSYLAGCCHFVLDTDLLSLGCQNYSVQWDRVLLLFSTMETFFLPVCFFLIWVLQSILSPPALFPFLLNLCLPLLSPNLPLSSIFIFPPHYFHHSWVLTLHVSLSSIPKGKRCWHWTVGIYPGPELNIRALWYFVLNSWMGLRWSLWMSFTLGWVNQDLVSPHVFQNSKKIRKIRLYSLLDLNISNSGPTLSPEQHFPVEILW